MFLVIQVPCYNEAATLGTTLADLPKHIEGIDRLEIVIVDDGSDDNTAAVARACGVSHVVTHSKNLGLARAFMSGLDYALSLGADVIVNTDADNQYQARWIPDLIGPICAGQADIVIGERPIAAIAHFSRLKRFLQRLGSLVVRLVSGTQVQDAPSGLRAFSRDAALRLNVFNEYTYTLESIIQAGHKNMHIVSVPIAVNQPQRPSRLIKSIPGYISKSLGTIVRIFVVYRPFRFFMLVGLVLFGIGVLIGLRFLYFRYLGIGAGNVQSLILGAVFLLAGFQTMLFAFMADIIAVNRQLLEDIQYQLRRADHRPDPASGR